MYIRTNNVGNHQVKTEGDYNGCVTIVSVAGITLSAKNHSDKWTAMQYHKKQVNDLKNLNS